MNSVEIVRASAGSGKTYLLAAQYISAALKSPTAFRNILAVTFTNKATAEMKERIIGQLSKLSRGEDDAFLQTIIEQTHYSQSEIRLKSKQTLNEILRDYSSFAVSTIDKFFQRIIRSFFKELGLELNYEVVIDIDSTITETIERIVELSHTNSDVANRINRIVEQQLDSGLRVDMNSLLFEMLRSALYNDFATPASTNSELIEQVYALLEEQYKAISHAIEQRCGQACDLMERGGLSPLDFKYKKSSFASYFFKVRGSGAIEQYNSYFNKAAMGGEKECLGTTNLEAAREALPQLLLLTQEVKELYDSSIEVRTTFEAISSNFTRYTLLRQLCDEFFAILSSRGELSIGSTTSLIRTIATEAEVPFIFERLGSRYTTIFIDEFQDTSLGQWEGFLPLIEEAAAKSEQRCVMLIGDIKQAIYRFRGGDWRLIGGAAAAELGNKIDSDARVLKTSWRSEEQIVEFNNAVMEEVVRSGQNEVDKLLEKATTPDNRATQEYRDELSKILSNAYQDMRQEVAPHRKGNGKGYVELNYEQDSTLVMEWLSEKITELKTRFKASQIAILVRNRKQGETVVEQLIESKIEFISEDSLKISSSPTANFIVTIFNMAISGINDISRAAANRYLGRALKTEFTPQEIDLVNSLRAKSSIEAMEITVRHFNISHREVNFLHSLHNSILTHCKRTGYDLRSFTEAYNNKLCNTPVSLTQNDSAVRVITIHKSKGLEFDAVLIPFTSWALLPDQRTTIWGESDVEPYNILHKIPITYNATLANSIYSPSYFDESISAIVDNINLLYVALTRPKKELYVGISRGRKGVSAATLLLQATERLYEEQKTSFGKPYTAEHKPTTEQARQGSTIEIKSFEGYDMPPLKIQKESPGVIDPS